MWGNYCGTKGFQLRCVNDDYKGDRAVAVSAHYCEIILKIGTFDMSLMTIFCWKEFLTDIK